MKFSEKGAGGGVKGRSEIFRKFIRIRGDRLPLDHESMVQVLGLRLWGEIRIPEVLGSNTQTSSLYLKLRLTDLGLEVLVFEPYA